jgi:hypothetical protein
LEETEGNEESVEGHMRINEARIIGLDTKEASQRDVALHPKQGGGEHYSKAKEVKFGCK